MYCGIISGNGKSTLRVSNIIRRASTNIDRKIECFYGFERLHFQCLNLKGANNNINNPKSILIYCNLVDKQKKLVYKKLFNDNKCVNGFCRDVAQTFLIKNAISTMNSLIGKPKLAQSNSARYTSKNKQHSYPMQPKEMRTIQVIVHIISPNTQLCCNPNETQ